MRILVTGGLGFIGSNFCRYILSKHSDHEVISMDKIGIGASPANLKDLKKEKQYQFVKGDICDSRLISEVIEKVDAVVHMAAETHVDRSIANPFLFIKNNTIGTFTVLEALRKHNDKARLVHVSTDEIYGEIIEGSFKENARLNPSNPYSASKAAADMLVIAYHKTYELKTIITRCTNNFGPYQFPEKFIPKTIIRALLNLKVPIYGSGKHIRDWIYVTDHCEALDLVLRKGTPGEIYNISAGNELENIKIAEMILELLGKNKDLIEFVEDRPGHDVKYSLDSTKIRNELVWKPKHNFKEGLKKTVDWYLSNEWWWKPLIDEKILHQTPWKLK